MNNDENNVINNNSSIDNQSINNDISNINTLNTNNIENKKKSNIKIPIIITIISLIICIPCVLLFINIFESARANESAESMTGLGILFPAFIIITLINLNVVSWGVYFISYLFKKGKEKGTPIIITIIKALLFIVALFALLTMIVTL